MIRRVLPGLLLVLLAGCVEENWLRDRWSQISGEPAELQAVTPNPFGQTVVASAPNRGSLAPASLEAAARVDTLGRQLLAANQQLGLKPLFVTVGAPQPEVFHAGTNEVFVTEGLVKKCSTDSQLAAVLCLELGKMVAAREERAGPALRTPERPPPLEMRVGNDQGAGFGEADQIRRAELAKFEKERGYGGTSLPPDLNPKVLAATYLYRAGHNPKELDAVAPLLKEAAENRSYAKQLTGAPPARPWTR